MLLPGKSHGQRSLVGYGPWGHKELDTTEQLHFHFHFSHMFKVLLGGSDSKNLPTMWETQIQSLGQEDPLEEGMAILSSILAWRSP